MKIFFILFFCILWVNLQKAQSFPQQDSAFFNCSEEDKRVCLKRAQDRVQRLMEHAEDTFENMEQLLSARELNTNVKDVRQTEYASWLKFIELIQKLEHEDSPFEELIKEFFEDRFLVLAQMKILEHGRKSLDLIGLMATKATVEQNPELREHNVIHLGVEITKPMMLDKLEIFEDLIVDLLSLTVLHKLQDDVKRLIAASPSLHSKIQGIKENQQNCYNSRHRDFSLYSNHIDLKSPPGGIFESTLSGYRVELPSESPVMGAGRPQKRLIPSLKFPDFLKDPPQTPSVSGELLDDLKPEAKIKKKKRRSKAKKSRKKAETLPAEAVTEVSQIASQENEPEPMGPNQKSIPQESEVISPKITVVATPSSSKLEELKSEKPEFPKETAPPELQLKGRHLQTHETIFSAKPNNVSFDAFKALWNFLGGKVLSNRGGGSHRVLKWNEKAIGGTHVPHGGHDYGPRSIRSLREALSAIGWGSEKPITSHLETLWVTGKS